MRSDCPPHELLDQFLAEQLTPSREDDLESHLQSCRDCQERLEQLVANVDATPPLRVNAHAPLSSEFAQRLHDSLSDSLSSSRHEDDAAIPELPGYELLEMVGRGGSSLVFQARDQKFQRIVAVKVLREKADAADRERFSREAKALASLRHPNITRAHDVGEADGRKFLVMEFVPGGSLGRYIGGLPQEPLAAARVVRQLAEAMQTAHDAGFVHRDLKPTNVLLDAHFGQGETSGLDRFVPKVTDLGVVKDLSRDDGFTQTRDCLGTPSYMAPEQVKGSSQSVDCRTDVYALGAILYELLTGRPPFRAGSPLDTMLQVKHDEPVTPSRFHPKLPRDLETICLKCLEKEPARRYQTAQLLADDLERVLQGKSIHARRTGWSGRAWRWGRRNPGWATAGLIALFLLLALAIGGPLLAKREHDLRKRANEQEQLAQSERTRARDHAALASKALDDSLGQLLRSARLQDTALDETRATMVRGLLPYYEQLVQTDSPDPMIRIRQSRALLELAAVHARESHSDKAREAYQRALRILTALAAEPSDASTNPQLSLAAAHFEFGRFLQISDNDALAAEREYRKALELHSHALIQNPKDHVRRDNVAITNALLGTLLQEQAGRVGEAREFLTRAVVLRDQLVADLPEREDLRHYAALCHYNLAMLHRQANDHEHEIQQFNLALELERPLAKSTSVKLETPYFLSAFEGELGIAYGRANQNQAAIRHLQAALLAAQALEVSFPGVKKYADLREHWRGPLEYVLKQPHSK